MTWFERIVPSRIKTERRTRSVPEGLWTKCPACDAVLYRAEIERNLHVCPKCSHHMRINGRERLLKFLDTGSTQGDRRQGRGRGSAQIQGLEALQGPHRAGAEADRRARCADRDVRDSWPASTSWHARSNSASWAAPWDRWSARNSCARSSIASSTARRWCASRRAAAPACRRRCTRCCKWPRPARPSSACRRRGCRSFRS